MAKGMRISAKGQVTLPRELRESLSLRPGDELVYTTLGDRMLVTPKNVDFNDLAGFLGVPPNGRASLQQIDKTVVKEGGASAAEPLKKKMPKRDAA
jgi:AbrB family looped-hinge helix DNA binding protein